MEKATPEQAVAHPNWNMGAKISVDSATMMNKGLEIIEACHLFRVPAEKIEVLVHPQSIVHSAVGYIDGSVLAHMGMPDMRTPIAYALGYPERIASPTKRLDFTAISGLTFSHPDEKRFPALRVAKELSLDGWRAELLPGDKVDALREICGGDTKKTIYVGDGVNDGPVLVTSETGIAMGGFGSQVAVEAADAVILDDSPAKVADLLRIAKKTRAIVWQNVALALGVKGVFLVLGASGHAGLWEAVFADVGVALMAILNATRATRLK